MTAARAEANQLVAALVRNGTDTVRQGSNWRVDLINQSGMILLSLFVVGSDPPIPLAPEKLLSWPHKSPVNAPASLHHVDSDRGESLPAAARLRWPIETRLLRRRPRSRLDG